MEAFKGRDSRKYEKGDMSEDEREKVKEFLRGEEKKKKKKKKKKKLNGRGEILLEY